VISITNSEEQSRQNYAGAQADCPLCHPELRAGPALAAVAE
jgi:hypothetical protein